MLSAFVVDLDRELSLAAMWHAYRASDCAAQNIVEIDTGVVHALLNARYYDAGIRHTDQSARSDMIRSCPWEARRNMDWDEYFRQQAAMYRKLAEKTEDAFIKQELLDLAAVCEEVANNIEDHQTSG
jgi:hypothetical protein